MAKGEGGGGHYDERRRSNVKSAYAGSDEVVREILKPRSKPKPKVKKKQAVAIPRAKPSRVKVESHSGEVPEPGTSMITTRINPGRALPRHMPMPQAKPRQSLSDFIESLRSGGRVRPQPSMVDHFGLDSSTGRRLIDVLEPQILEANRSRRRSAASIFDTSGARRWTDRFES